MKILHIIPNLKKGGAERLVIDIVRVLAADHTVQIKLILFENSIGYYVDDIIQCIDVVPSHVQLSVFRKNSFEIMTLQNAIETFNPDIIHTHLYETEIISRSCYFPKALWYSHAHDRMKSFNAFNLMCLTNKRQWTDYVERRYLFKRYKKNGGNQFIAVSKDIESFLNSVLPRDHQNVHRLENAIDINRFKRPATLAEKSLGQPIHLISIGRLDSNKNHQFLLDCMSDLKERGLPFHLTILGEGDQRTFLENKINSLNLCSEVTLAGAKEEVEEYLWQADLYVHSALSEGFGLTLIEAMAAGLPVVSLDGQGNKELIQNGFNGYMVEMNDQSRFVDCLVKIVKDKYLHRMLSNNAQNVALEFDINRYIVKLLEIYKGAIECVELRE
jgi:glycosyltransferase involved in cell wall biosynthesis